MATLTMSSETLTQKNSDTFARSSSGSFGTADDINADTWVRAGGAATLNVTSNEGVISATTGTTQLVLGSQTSSDTDVIVRFSLSSTSDYAGVMVRRTDANNYYAFYYNGGSYRIYKFVGGIATQLQSFTFSTSTGTYYYMRFRTVGTMLQAKVWLASNTEPTAFNAYIVDSTYSSGSAGILAKTTTASPGGVMVDSWQFSSYSNADTLAPIDTASMSTSFSSVTTMSDFDITNAVDVYSTVATALGTESSTDTIASSDKSTSVRVMQGGDSSTDVLQPNESGIIGQPVVVTWLSSMGGIDAATVTDASTGSVIHARTESTPVSDTSTSVAIHARTEVLSLQDSSVSQLLMSGTESVSATDNGMIGQPVVVVWTLGSMGGIDLAPVTDNATGGMVHARIESIPVTDSNTSQLIIQTGVQQVLTQSDTFANRTVSASTNANGWGTASDTEMWARQGTGVTLSVNSGEGLVASPTGSAFLVLGSITGTDQDVYVRFATTSTSDIVGLCARYTSQNNMYRADINGSQLRLRKIVGGTSTYLATPNFTVTPGTFYWMHLKVAGINQYARVWVDGNSEPSTWLASGSDSSLSSGSAAVYVNPISTNNVQFDHFSSSLVTGQTSYADGLTSLDGASSLSTMAGNDVAIASDSGFLFGPSIAMQGTDVLTPSDSASITSVNTVFEQSPNTTSSTRTQIEQIAHDVLRNELLYAWNPNANYTGNGANIPGGLFINWEWNQPTWTNRQGDGVTNQAQYQTAHDPQTCLVYLHSLSEYLLLHPEDKPYFDNPNAVGVNLTDFTAHVINDFTAYGDLKFFVYLDILACGQNLNNSTLMGIAQSIGYNQMNNYLYGYFWKQRRDSHTYQLLPNQSYTTNYAIGEAAIVLDNALRYPTQSYTSTSTGTTYSVNDMIAAAKSAIDHVLNVAREPNYGLFYDGMNVDTSGNGNDTPLNTNNTSLCRVSTQIEAAESLLIAASILGNFANASINANFYDPTRAATYRNAANTAIQSSYNLLWDDGSTITTSALTSGATYTSINVQYLPYDYYVGCPLVIGNGATTQTVYVTQDAPVGYANVKVASAPGGTNFIANANYAAQTRVAPGSASTVPTTNGGFFYSVETGLYRKTNPNTTLDPTQYTLNKAYKETRSTAVTLRTASFAHNQGDTSLDGLMQQCVNTLIDPTKFYKVDPTNGLNCGYVYEVLPSFAFYPLKTTTNGVQGTFVLSQITSEAQGDVASSLLDAQNSGAITQTSSTYLSSTPPQYLSDGASSVSVMSGIDSTPYAVGNNVINVPWHYHGIRVVTTMSGVDQVAPYDYGVIGQPVVVVWTPSMSGVDSTPVTDTSTGGIVHARTETLSLQDSGTLSLSQVVMSGVDSTSVNDIGVIGQPVVVVWISSMSGVDALAVADAVSMSAVSTATDSTSLQDNGILTLTVLTMSGADTVVFADSGTLQAMLIMQGNDAGQVVDVETVNIVAQIADAIVSTDTASFTVLLLGSTDVILVQDTGLLTNLVILMSGMETLPLADAGVTLLTSTLADTVQALENGASVLSWNGNDTLALLDTGVLTVSQLVMSGTENLVPSDTTTSSSICVGNDGVAASESGYLLIPVLPMSGADSLSPLDIATWSITSSTVETVSVTESSQFLTAITGLDRTQSTDTDASQLGMVGYSSVASTDSGIVFISFMNMAGVDTLQPSESGAIINLVLQMFGVDTLQGSDLQALTDMMYSDVSVAVLSENGTLSTQEYTSLQHVTAVFTFSNNGDGVAIRGQNEIATWYQGQTYPLVLCVLRTERDRAIDLTQATGYQMVMRSLTTKNAQNRILTGSLVIFNKRQGILSYAFSDDDVAIAGNYGVVLRVDFNGRYDESDTLQMTIIPN